MILSKLIPCAGIFFLSACALIYPERVPIPSKIYQTGSKQSTVLMVMLPGQSSKAVDFDTYGFIKALRDRKIDADALTLEAHPGYYMRQTLLNRMYTDIILPAREKGYRQIWLCGISMGGLGALLFTKKYPELVTGVILLAPFMGDKEVINEIEKAGGVKSWKPILPISSEDYQRDLWHWLQKYTDRPGKAPALYIGWGTSDRFARANRLLGDVLPAKQLITISGDHDWETWVKIFPDLLEAAFTR